MDLLQACYDSPQLRDTILSCIQHPVIVTDIDGRISSASPVVTKVLGFSPDELEARNLSVILTPEDLTCLYPNLLCLARKNEPFDGELLLVRKNKSRFFALVSFRPFFESNQNKTIVVIFIQDIDKQKQLEKAFKGLQYQDLVHLANGIAHELRNPLVSIGGFVNRLYKECRASNNHDAYYSYITSNLEKIEGLIKKIEFFVQLPAPCVTEEGLRDLVEEALQPHLQQIKQQNIEVTTNLEEVRVFVDKGLVGKAFSMVVENALDALSDEGKILIRSEKIDNTCKIYLTDTGCGVLPEDLPYIFNPFFSTKPYGAGIGLPVVKRIMESHEGLVELTSKPGEGATVLLSFPLERRRSIRVARLEE